MQWKGCTGAGTKDTPDGSLIVIRFGWCDPIEPQRHLLSPSSAGVPRFFSYFIRVSFRFFFAFINKGALKATTVTKSALNPRKPIKVRWNSLELEKQTVQFGKFE